jgi:hypothetical protein
MSYQKVLCEVVGFESTGENHVKATESGVGVFMTGQIVSDFAEDVTEDVLAEIRGSFGADWVPATDHLSSDGWSVVRGSFGLSVGEELVRNGSAWVAFGEGRLFACFSSGELVGSDQVPFSGSPGSKSDLKSSNRLLLVVMPFEDIASGFVGRGRGFTKFRDSEVLIKGRSGWFIESRDNCFINIHMPSYRGGFQQSLPFMRLLVAEVNASTGSSTAIVENSPAWSYREYSATF